MTVECRPPADTPDKTVCFMQRREEVVPFRWRHATTAGVEYWERFGTGWYETPEEMTTDGWRLHSVIATPKEKENVDA